MTAPEFISLMQSRGAIIYPPYATRATELANMNLQARRCAIMPVALREFYQHAGGANLGNGYIFGPADVSRGALYPVPGIVRVNTDMSRAAPVLAGRTIFGRNDLFYFAFDAFGTFYMLNNLNFQTLKKYDDPFAAMSDCLMGGRC